MSTNKPMLDHLTEMPRKELVDDVIFYHDGWIAAGRECNELKAENAKLREQVMQLKDDWEGERDYADQMEAKEIQAVAENAKLRDDLETQREAAWHNTNRNAREYKRVCDESAKLRELAKKLKACNSSCGRCIELYGICEHETELRELRVEVNDA